MSSRGKALRVTVTQDHITKGISSPESCPIALAIEDAGWAMPFVDPYCVSAVYMGKRYTSHKVSKKAEDFMCRFDDSNNPKPGKFTFYMGCEK